MSDFNYTVHYPLGGQTLAHTVDSLQDAKALVRELSAPATTGWNYANPVRLSSILVKRSTQKEWEIAMSDHAAHEQSMREDEHQRYLNSLPMYELDAEGNVCG